MQLIVKILNGAEHSIEVQPDSSVHEIKTRISTTLNIPINHQRLMYKGKPLADSNELKDYGIKPGTKIHLSVKKEDKIDEIEDDTPFNKELRDFAKNHFNDADLFVELFNKEMENYVQELNLDDIERYNEFRWKEEHGEDLSDEEDNSTASASIKRSNRSVGGGSTSTASNM